MSSSFICVFETMISLHTLPPARAQDWLGVADLEQTYPQLQPVKYSRLAKPIDDSLDSVI
jgi:hypothetical protein